MEFVLTADAIWYFKLGITIGVFTFVIWLFGEYLPKRRAKKFDALSLEVEKRSAEEANEKKARRDALNASQKITKSK